MRNIIIIPLDCQIVLFVPGDKNGVNIFMNLFQELTFYFKKKRMGSLKKEIHQSPEWTNPVSFNCYPS